jgi:PilZ domain
MSLVSLAKLIATLSCFISITALYINKKLKRERGQAMERLKKNYAEKMMDSQHSEPSLLLSDIEENIVKLQIQRDLLLAKIYVENERKIDERRRSLRKSLLKPVLVRIGESPILGYITNFSVSGTSIRLQSADSFNIDKELRFEVEGYPLEGKVAHISKKSAVVGVHVVEKRQQRTMVQLLSA